MNSEEFLVALLKNNDVTIAEMTASNNNWTDAIFALSKDTKDIAPVYRQAAITHALKDFRDKFMVMQLESLEGILERILKGKKPPEDKPKATGEENAKAEPQQKGNGSTGRGAEGPGPDNGQSQPDEQGADNQRQNEAAQGAGTGDESPQTHVQEGHEEGVGGGTAQGQGD